MKLEWCPARLHPIYLSAGNSERPKLNERGLPGGNGSILANHSTAGPARPSGASGVSCQHADEFNPRPRPLCPACCRGHERVQPGIQNWKLGAEPTLPEPGTEPGHRKARQDHSQNPTWPRCSQGPKILRTRGALGQRSEVWPPGGLGGAVPPAQQQDPSSLLGPRAWLALG